jgi:hypothetical protein
MKKILLALLSTLLMVTSSFAIEHIEIGMSLGSELTTSGIGFYGQGNKYRYSKKVDKLEAQMMGTSPTMSIFGNIFLSEKYAISIASNFSFFRNYTITLNDGTQNIGSQIVTYHSIGTDILFKERKTLNEYVALEYAWGLGIFANTAPKYISNFYDGTTEMGSVELSKMYVGLNLVSTLGVVVRLGEKQYLHLGSRTAIDLLAFSHKQGIPKEGVLQQAALTPTVISFNIGYSMRF